MTWVLTGHLTGPTRLPGHRREIVRPPCLRATRSDDGRIVVLRPLNLAQGQAAIPAEPGGSIVRTM